MKCEMVKEGDLSELLDLLEKLPSPIGIMVFGPDQGAKNKVFSKIVSKIRNIPSYSGGSSNAIPSWPVATTVCVGDNAIVKMDGETSTSYGERHRLVLGMRNNGAATVIGVYVKGDPKTPKEDVKKQIAKLEKRPPTVDGLDFLITISTQ